MIDDATKLMDDAGQAYPLDPLAAEADEPCPHCATTIPAGEQFCPKCGYQRGTWREGGEAEETAVPEVAAPFVLVGEGGLRLPLPVGEVILGRGDVELKLSDGYISRSHARLSVSEDGVTVTDLGSANGTFIGEVQLAKDEPAELEEGGSLRVGRTELTLERQAPPEEAAATAEEPAEPEGGAEDAATAAGEETMEEHDAEKPGEEPAAPLAEASLELQPAESCWSLSRVGADEVLYLRYGETTLGRKAEKCDLVLRGDGYISGCHAKVVVSETTIELTDLGSTNGTFVGEEKLEAGVARQLGPGDAVRLGRTELVVQYNELGGATSEVEDEEEGAQPPAESTEEPPEK